MLTTADPLGRTTVTRGEGRPTERHGFLLETSRHPFLPGDHTTAVRTGHEITQRAHKAQDKLRLRADEAHSDGLRRADDEYN